MPIILDGWAGATNTTRNGASQDVTASTTSSQSTTLGLTTILVRLCATVQCRYAIGANPTAASNSTLLPANWVEEKEVNPGDKIAVISTTTTPATLNITELIVRRGNTALTQNISV